MPGVRLLTIPISHFCEKARWALQRAQVPFPEERHLQGFHMAHAMRAGRSRTVPVLIAPGGVVLTESADIMRWADRGLAARDRLYPEGLAAEAGRFGARLDEGFGVDGRLWMYHATLPVMEQLEPYIVGGIPSGERRFFGVAKPVLDRMIRRYLDVSAETAAAALERINGVFDDVGRRLEDGRPFLFGDRFTAADLTFAALAAPCLLPEQYGSPMPGLEIMPPAMASEVARLRAHPAGAFGLRVYAEERGRTVIRRAAA